MSKSQFTGTATQPQRNQRNRNATANFVNLIRTSTVHQDQSCIKGHTGNTLVQQGEYLIS